MEDTWILGINAYHADASACLLYQGQIVAAAEEERFRRIKHYAGFPSAAIRYCLDHANITLSELDTIAINNNSSANFFRKISFLMQNKLATELIFDRMRNRHDRSSIIQDLEKEFPEKIFQGKIKKIEHHLAHLASSFFASSFSDALAVSLDGFGDFVSGAWGLGQDNRLNCKGRIYFPHSLGIFYQAMTQFLGFPHYGDEYKVMGLASYGKPSYVKKLQEMIYLNKNNFYELNLQYFNFHQKPIGSKWQDGMPEINKLYNPHLESLLGPERDPQEPLTERHYDLAASTQAVYEMIFFEFLRGLHKKYSQNNLALSGGCALNAVANGKILENTPFKQVFVPSIAGDAGGALGAAWLAHHQNQPLIKTRKINYNHAYWGPEYSAEEIAEILTNHPEISIQKKYSMMQYVDEAQLLNDIATAIAQGKVVGWFQGRMELGPRALGNRSILCDPRRADIKDILNLKIKKRESFRPFAPSILREAMPVWFEFEDDVPCMTKVYKIREDKQSLIPAVTHIDGTGRVQTVSYETNSRYYQLIKTFEKITDIPILLNTSFNENEPIVCSPKDALDCFFKTKMDVLVLQDWIISR